MSSTEPVTPLKDVWLRPRRVFRELSLQPVRVIDYVLAAAQGCVNCLALYRSQGAGLHESVEAIIGNSFLFGPIAGILSLLFFAAVYRRLGVRAGGSAKRSDVIHVLAYGGVPLVAALALWILTALLAGETAFVPAPSGDTEMFVVLLLRVQFITYVLLFLWSVVLQIMGFSEIEGLTVLKAFRLWLLGQLVGLLAAFLLAIVTALLMPGVIPSAAH